MHFLLNVGDDADRDDFLERLGEILIDTSTPCYWAVRELGVSGTKVGRPLSLSQPAVSRSVARGEKLAQGMKLSIAR
jgi:hypothetical protein